MLAWLQHRFPKKSTFEKKLYSILGFYPKNAELYRQALTHKSYKKRGGLDNERLEFLGDALLGSVVAEILYAHFPNGKEGFLTQMRSKIVSRKTQNKIAAEIGLKKVVRYHKTAAHRSVFGNALEALVGAVYLDQGQDKTMVFIQEKLLLPHIDLEALTKEEVSYKSRVLEWAQQKKKKMLFEILSSEGKDHKKHYKVVLKLSGKVLSEGEGSSIKRAEEQAAKKGHALL